MTRGNVVAHFFSRAEKVATKDSEASSWPDRIVGTVERKRSVIRKAWAREQTS